MMKYIELLTSLLNIFKFINLTKLILQKLVAGINTF